MRLIDADALKDYYQHRGEYSLISDELMEDVNIQPTVDAVLLEDYMSMVRTVNKLAQALADSVKHGHWGEERFGHENKIVCSVCGCFADKWTDYCPNCGAMMDEVEDETN